MGNVSERVLLKAAKNVMPAYAGRDLDRAMQLLDVYDQLDKVRSGEIAAADMNISGEIPNHVLNMLQTLPPDEATAILGETLKSAAAFFNVQEKIDDEVIETQNQRNTKAYNFALSVNIGEVVPASTMQKILSPSDFATFTETYEGQSVSGLEAKNFIEGALNGQFWMDKTQQEALRAELDIAGDVKFAAPGKHSDIVHSRLVGLAEAGELTVAELNANSASITAAQNTALTMKIFNEGDEALNEGSRLIKRRFKYNEQDAKTDNPKLAQASKTAFEAADAELLDEYMRREAEGNPMTRSEIRAFALQQVEQFQSIYAEALREEYEQDIAQFSDPHPGLSIDPADPIGSIDAWYSGLSETAQQTKRNAYAVMKARIKAKYANTGLY
jgi:ABC-type transporter MlaC component